MEIQGKANTDKRKAYRKDYYEKHKAYFQAHYQNNKQRYHDASRAWYLRNKGRFDILARRRKRNQEIKLEILTYYSNANCACVKCGESRLACLSIDHINGGGTQHRKSIKSGYKFYYWLKRNGCPSGYQTLCMNCQFAKMIMDNELLK